MSEQDKHRIEKDALERYPKKSINGFDFPDYNVRERNSYTAGATVENERMASLIEKAFVAGRSKTSWEQFKADCLASHKRPNTITSQQHNQSQDNQLPK